MADAPPGGSAKDRLLLAAADLLDAGNDSFSTRAVCERAGVTAPTLYHHFGNKKGLIDAVLSHGFGQYVAAPSGEHSHDPIGDIRRGWDQHVAYGLAHPAFYARLYGAVRPGQPCAVTSPAVAALSGLFEEAARRGQIRVAPAEAARQVHAANVGVTLSLIAQLDGERDSTLSDRVREAALSAVMSDETAHRAARRHPRRGAAIALAAALEQNGNDLSVGETALLRELLDRLARADG